MGASVIIAAAGAASRMQGKDKILCKINGKEVLLYSVLAFDSAECTDKIVVVTSQEKTDAVKGLLESAHLSVPFEVTCGGDTRQKSVYNALKCCDEKSDAIMIHDGARPMVTSKLIDTLYKEVIKNKKDAAAVGVKVKDTIKKVSQNGEIDCTIDRESLVAIQTPQCFDSKLYNEAYKAAIEKNNDYTDDCQLVEALGKKVYVVEGDYKNIKITTPDDLILAQTFLKEREK